MKTNRAVESRRCAWAAAVFVAAAAGGGLLWAAEGDEQPADARQASWSDYSIVTQRNIFSRNRGRRAERSPGNGAREAPAPVTLAPESYMVLKGIVAAGRTFAAFIEDTRTNEVFRVMAGGAIGAGTVTTLTLDSIVYKQRDKESSILVGQTLLGASGQTVLTFDNLMQWSTTEPTATPGGTAPAAETTSEAEAETLKKLLERRKQQLGE
jgi:hypothetical protein